MLHRPGSLQELAHRLEHFEDSALLNLVVGRQRDQNLTLASFEARPEQRADALVGVLFEADAT